MTPVTLPELSPDDLDFQEEYNRKLEESLERKKLATKNLNNLDIIDTKYDGEDGVIVKFNPNYEGCYNSIKDMAIPCKFTISQIIEAVNLGKLNYEKEFHEVCSRDIPFNEKAYILSFVLTKYNRMELMSTVWLKDKNPSDLVEDALKLELEYYELHKDEYALYRIIHGSEWEICSKGQKYIVDGK
jgi:hypothetical protein